MPEGTSSTSSLRSQADDNLSLRGARSFSRLESTNGIADPLTSSLHRLQTESVIHSEDVSPVPEREEDSDDEDDGKVPGSAVMPEGFEELPSELVSLTDRFIDSLTQPVLPAPLTVEQLSNVFQQFYVTAFQIVEQHISHSYLSLSSKKPRTTSSSLKAPTPMISFSEISQKKRDRKLLDAKKMALEEAVEKRVTEGVYEKIWRHKSTDDEARDQSLRSKIAALKVVGVDLKHLGVELKVSVDDELRPAVAALTEMSEIKYPLGKLTLLKKAHKAIVDCLTSHISSASADFILPTLIYTLIISPPAPEFNVISNLYFIQRFRSSRAIDGEAAYCLTNLEAAVSFLETVDLATLKIEGGEDDLTEKEPLRELDPAAASFPESPNMSERRPPAVQQNSRPTFLGVNTSASSSTTSLHAPEGNRPRKSSFLTPIDLAVSTADQGLRGIGTTLESSYKFLFGKMEKQGEDVPKTLEDAQKLINSPTLVPDPVKPGLISAIDGALKRVGSEVSVQSLKPNERDRSRERSPSPSPNPLSKAATMPVAGAVAVGESVKNFGSQIGRFANMGVMRGFSRNATSTTLANPVAATGKGVGSGGAKGLGIVDDEGKGHSRKESAPVADLLSTFPDLAQELKETEESRKETKIEVNQKFLQLEDAGALRIGEVAELLADYRRLALEVTRRGLAE